MIGSDNHTGWATLTGRLVETGLGALRNRGELLLVEWQEEKARLTELLFLAIGLIFLALMTLMLVTATIIFLFPEHLRLYVAGGFSALYLAAAIWVLTTIKNLVKREPFSETINQMKKDAECVESFK